MSVRRSTPIPLYWRNVIRFERLRRGWSQRELAEQAGHGMTQGMVSSLERGERDPLLSTVMRLLAALDITLELTLAQDDTA